MKTYPHQEGGDIIQLVRKDEYDAVVRELNERLTKQQADMLDTIVQLRLELTRWQLLAERLATALDDCNTKLVGWHGLYPSQVGSDDEATFQAGDKAIAAYESAKSGNLPDPLAEAVKRMEAVPLIELSAAWDKTDVRGVRARLISAAKGEQP